MTVPLGYVVPPGEARCPDCNCPKERCDSYGYGQKCCPDCKHVVPPENNKEKR